MTFEMIFYKFFIHPNLVYFYFICKLLIVGLIMIKGTINYII